MTWTLYTIVTGIKGLNNIEIVKSVILGRLVTICAEGGRPAIGGPHTTASPF